jgi:hypothetical protein
VRSCSPGLTLQSEDEGGTFVRNIAKSLLDCTAYAATESVFFIATLGSSQSDVLEKIT